MATCLGCPLGDNHVADDELVDHVRLLHPDLFGDGPERWPDGTVVVVDDALEPDDFEGWGDAV